MNFTGDVLIIGFSTAGELLAAGTRRSVGNQAGLDIETSSSSEIIAERPAEPSARRSHAT